MMDYFSETLTGYGIPSGLVEILSILTVLLLALLLSGVLYGVAKKVLLPLLGKRIRKNKIKWDDVFLDSKFIDRILLFIPLIILNSFQPIFDSPGNLYERILFTGFTLVLGLSIGALLNALNLIYSSYEIAKERPIKGMIQIIKIVFYIILVIAGVANLLGQSPLVYLSGFGATAAVFSFIFKDSILGLVAGMLLSINDMLRIGDWIEMPRYGANGDVIDITMNTVKVQNFDKTITTVPAYAMISDSFINWRGMLDQGARRLKRSVTIDITSVRFLTPESVEALKKVQLIRGYLEEKEKEIEGYNREKGIDESLLINGRHLTNLGVFRIYLIHYLKDHPRVHQGMTQMVRQLEPSETGVPLELYVFVDDIDWASFETVQSDIFDHIFAVVDNFGLRIFQNPSGSDFRSLRGEV